MFRLALPRALLQASPCLSGLLPRSSQGILCWRALVWHSTRSTACHAVHDSSGLGHRARPVPASSASNHYIQTHSQAQFHW